MLVVNSRSFFFKYHCVFTISFENKCHFTIKTSLSWLVVNPFIVFSSIIQVYVERTTYAVSERDVRALEYEVPSAFDTRWSRKSHGSRSLNGDFCVWSETSTLKNAFQQRRVSSSDRNFCLVPNQNANFNCGDVIAARHSRSRSRSSADFRAGFTLFRRDRVSLSGPPLEHCGDTVLAESRLLVTRRIWNSPPKLTCSSAREELSRGFIPRRMSRGSRHCEVCVMSRLRIPSILNEDRYRSWRKIKLHLYLNRPLAEIRFEIYISRFNAENRINYDIHPHFPLIIIKYIS